MAKHIIDNLGLNGIIPNSDRVGGSYSDVRDVNPFTNPGYITPGWAESVIANSGDGVLRGLITDALIMPSSTDSYAVDGNYLYKLTPWADAFVNTSAFPHSISAGGASAAYDLFSYHLSGSSRLFYIGQNDIGMYDYNATFDEDWGSTVPSGAGDLQTAPHPKIEFNGYYYIGNGRYLAKLDGGVSSATIDLDALDLGYGWEITSLFKTQNYIGVCAWIKGNDTYNKTECAVFLYDGVSITYTSKIPIEAHKIISSINNNGEVILITSGGTDRTFVSSVRRLTNDGSKTIFKLRFNQLGTNVNYSMTKENAIESFDNGVVVGVNGTNAKNSILYYGSPSENFNPILSFPFSDSTTPSAAGEIGFLGKLTEGVLYSSFRDDGIYKWSKYVTNYSTNAYWKGVYKDLGQRVRINYIKFYYKPLVASDSVTVGLDIDYGTAVTLKDNANTSTITYTADGTTTSKKFKVGRDCHAFRPTITWTAGGTPFSKIEVDYDFIEDN